MTKRKRKALGKGLDEIFPGISEDEGQGAMEVSVGRIGANPFQPRKEWNRDEIASLARSIASQGILQPLVVRRSGGDFQLIAGERRLRAAIEAGLSSVPVIVREADDQQMLALALVENIQRKDLGPVEKAEAFSRLSSEFGLTQEQMGERVGMSRSAVANFQRLLDLPGKVLDLLRGGELSMGHGRALLGLSDNTRIMRVAVNAVKRELSVRQLEERVRELNTTGTGTERRKTVEESAETRKLQDSLQRILKTRVRIRGKAGAGRIEISYHSLEELDRLLELIRAGGNSAGKTAGK
ncbi:MAG: ParB/RepB/Spo0J family partition protein [Candidatus Fermentibacteraceae bacterium]|nr:ParB/RepB/Spo0J family partition protein [Candidatus Fermentibacteraceae bacterium]MBN2609573.1 ParB/RepB/Spo0J family partition protein [Candidatus Fermentibacteraceae bacterium]